MQKEIYNLTVEPITCVHVGTGEKATPMDYVVRSPKKNKKNILYSKYSWDRLLSRMENDKQLRDKFIEVSGNEKELLNFLYENWNDSVDREYFCQITQEFRDAYDSKKGSNPLTTAPEVWQMYRVNGNKPVIPGASIKGAMRTAVLNCFWNRGLIKNHREGKTDLSIQKRLLEYEDANDDPFRAVEIGDCVFLEGSPLVGMVRNIARARDPLDMDVLIPKGMKIAAEVMQGTMLVPKSRGVCRVAINSNLQKNGCVSKAISMKNIVESCNDFFKKKFENEYDKFYSNIRSGETKYIEVLKKAIKEIANSEDSFILRVGRWSQIDFMTYEGKGKTRSVFDYDGQYLPLGWCKCTLKKAGAAEANQ